MKNGFAAWFSSFIEGSAICRGFGRLGSFLYKKIGSGLYSFLFGSYDEMCDTFDRSRIGGALGGKNRAARYLASNIEESVYVSAVAAMMRYLSCLSLRVIGVFLMSCGFYSLLGQAVLFLIDADPARILSAAVSVLLIVLGIPLLLSGKPLCTAIRDSTVWNAFFTRFCGFHERSYAAPDGATGRKGAAFILGLPFGILTCFVHPLWLIVGCFAAIAAYIVLINPECGLYAAIFLMPFFVILPRPSIFLALLVIYTAFALGVKLLRGKRYFRAEPLDIFVFCFMAAMLLGGLASYGGGQSIRAAAIYAALMLGYYLTVGLVNTKEKLVRAAMMLCVSLLFVSLYGIYQDVSGNISAEWIDTEMFDNIGGRVVSTFENPNMLGEYLILLLPIVAAVFFGDRRLSTKPASLAAFAAGCLCLIYTWARGAWLGFLLAAVLFVLMWSRRSVALIAAGICLLPLAVPYLPANIISRFSSIGDLTDTSTNYRVFIWRGSARMAADYALTGVGVGEQAFNRIYPFYSFAGIEKAPHSHNLFLQIFIELGIFGFVLFIAMLICFLQSGFSLAKRGEDRAVRLIGCGAMCGVLAALLQGMTDYVWYNYRVFFLFWIVFGLCSAARRIDAASRRQKRATVSETCADITID